MTLGGKLDDPLAAFVRLVRRRTGDKAAENMKSLVVSR